MSEQLEVEEKIVDSLPDSIRILPDCLLLEISPEAKKRKGIILPNASGEGIFVRVARTGSNVREIEEGDRVMLHPSVTPNQYVTLVIEGKDYWVVAWHEIVLIKKSK